MAAGIVFALRPKAAACVSRSWISVRTLERNRRKEVREPSYPSRVLIASSHGGKKWGLKACSTFAAPVGPKVTGHDLEPRDRSPARAA
jgi:hypothetical protein